MSLANTRVGRMAPEEREAFLRGYLERRAQMYDIPVNHVRVLRPPRVSRVLPMGAIETHKRLIWKQTPAGYTVGALLAHIERQFLRGMTWENHGDWHVDHIIPLSSFKIRSTGDDEYRAAWALSNLRPLWAEDNCKKSNRRLFLL